MEKDDKILNKEQMSYLLQSRVTQFQRGLASVYAQIKIAAQEQGTSLSECDLWIAATALTLDAILVASDSDYERIVGLGLRLENWKN